MAEAIYAGTFDPVTNGHLDVIERGSRIFSRLVVAVARNIDKTPLFTPAERVDMLRSLVVPKFGNVEVESFDGLIVDYARRRGIACLLRGLRTISDFEIELQMALTNRDLAPDIETLFVMPSLQYSYVSSRLIRETVALGANLSHLIPSPIEKRLRERIREKEAERGRS